MPLLDDACPALNKSCLRDGVKKAGLRAALDTWHLRDFSVRLSARCLWLSLV